MSFLRGWCKKNLQPFQKAFFFSFFAREKGVEYFGGFMVSSPPSSLPPFSVSFHFFMSLLEDKS